MPPKPIADVIKWAQRMFGKFCRLHRMGPDMPPKPVADSDKWAQRIFGKFCILHQMGPVLSQDVSSIISDGPRHAAKICC